MKRPNHFIAAILFTSFVAGCLFFCTYQEWLIIYWNKPYTVKYTDSAARKKNVTLYYQHSNREITETAELLTPSHEQDAMKAFTNEWLSWLQEESVLSHKVHAGSLLYSPSGYEAYLSFDQHPFDTQWSIARKEQFLHGLLKTLKANGCTASLIYFLVDHKQLQDSHLDFSQGWSIQKDY